MIIFLFNILFYILLISHKMGASLKLIHVGRFCLHYAVQFFMLLKRNPQ